MPRVNISDEAFKKTEQVVDRPPVTKHNINDEYVRDPPHNHDDRGKNKGSSKTLKEGAYEIDEPDPEDEGTGGEAVGRPKKVDALSEIAQENSVHS
ncbi:hypothetical protein B0H34DRAFT_799860 [Crassisporium funariophilum]|nr:hypothetical protein B0H34DRAFT_799860 [Crassisporium funariophilum]